MSESSTKRTSGAGLAMSVSGVRVVSPVMV